MWIFLLFIIFILIIYVYEKKRPNIWKKIKKIINNIDKIICDLKLNSYKDKNFKKWK